MLGRVSLFPCFRRGNATPTIPHQLLHLKASAFQFGIADAVAVDGRRGSNLYEVNPWLWQFGHGRPRLGVLSVFRTEDRRDSAALGGFQGWVEEESRDPLPPRSSEARR